MGIKALPYETRVYINNQVLLPAMLVRALGIEGWRYAKITIEYRGFRTGFLAKLLRTRSTASRQFTIPREVREAYGIKPLDTVRVIVLEPTKSKEVLGT